MNICYTILHKYAYFYIFQPSLSTEELHAEMKNLEGLMKDLNSISNPSALHHHHHQGEEPIPWIERHVVSVAPGRLSQNHLSLSPSHPKRTNYPTDQAGHPCS